MRSKSIALLALAAMFGIAKPAYSQLLVSVDRGWYDSFGNHDPINKNYLAGSLNILSGLLEYRNWFAFDVPTGSDPIVAASLRLYNPAPIGYYSANPLQVYQLFDVDSPSFSIMTGGNGQMSIFDDLGSGALYGEKPVTTADNGQIIDIPLNAAAIVALNASIGGRFLLGGSLARSGTDDQFLFGFSGSPDHPLPGLFIFQGVPEPTSMVLLGSAFASAWIARRRNRT